MSEQSTAVGPERPKHIPADVAIGLLVMRVYAGFFIVAFHGWDKLINFSDKAAGFQDPIGVGSTMSLGLAVFAEVFCGIAVVLGLLTRLAVIPLIVMLLVAAWIVHADDPWQRKEFAMVYLIPFLTLLFTGPGPYSLDALIWPKVSKSDRST